MCGQFQSMVLQDDTAMPTSPEQYLHERFMTNGRFDSSDGLSSRLCFGAPLSVMLTESCGRLISLWDCTGECRLTPLSDPRL